MICFLDMDDVLVDFIRTACEILDSQYPPINYSWCEKNPNDWSKLDKIAGCLFYEFLPWMSDGKEILRIVERVIGERNIYLCTTSMPNPASATGKLLWVKHNLPQYYSRIIFTYAPKYLFAKQGALLIDDRNKNVDEFVSAGGDAILVPRPWNRLSQLQTVAYLEKELMKRF